jgi:hypothetical protein
MSRTTGWIASAFVFFLAGCSAADGDDFSAEQVEQSVVGQVCSPTSGGPLPTCGAALEYCNVGAACGVQGVCAARPRVCPAVVAPVCGCDGKTYRNACEAARAGVSVRSTGSCIIVH